MGYRTSWNGVLFASLTLTACIDRVSLGLPRIALSVASPDGSARAVVRNHPCIDPPCQSLWLEDSGGRRHRLRMLAEDQDWCHTVAWSADSLRVAFLVQDIQAVVVDAPTRATLLTVDLVPRWGYPPDKEVRELSFTTDGRALSFRVCTRPGNDCGERQETELPG